ncbi:MAG: hypothetical protein Q9212_002779 [Teloschistes hypoglaucus]
MATLACSLWCTSCLHALVSTDTFENTIDHLSLNRAALRQAMEGTVRSHRVLALFDHFIPGHRLLSNLRRTFALLDPSYWDTDLERDLPISNDNQKAMALLIQLEGIPGIEIEAGLENEVECNRCIAARVTVPGRPFLRCLQKEGQEERLGALAANGIGFFALTRLMAASDKERLCRPLTPEERLGALAAQGLKNTFAEIRHAACQFAVELQYFLQDEDRFWEYISPTGTDQIHSVAYFLTKMEGVCLIAYYHATLRQDKPLSKLRIVEAEL